jgi:hypothetical protein
MVFHTARVLEAADRGDADMARVLRILTPLVKFRACRDARRVTGDAMEVRGGCGYIEEWSDARVLRDAHLGSIWEGTSNIVALDVLRAARREGAFDALAAHLRTCLAEVEAPLAERLGATLDRVAALLRAVSGQDGPAETAETRRAASAAYHIASAVFLAWEGARLAGQHAAIATDRQRLAGLVLTEKLGPRDPLAPAEPEPDWLPDLLARAGRDTEPPQTATE